MGRGIMRYTAFLCCLFFLATVGGMFATWYFAEDAAKPVTGVAGITLSEFVWEPEEILPTESELGENHLALIELVLNENKKGYGLNYDSKNVLEGYLDRYGVVFSNQKTSYAHSPLRVSLFAFCLPNLLWIGVEGGDCCRDHCNAKGFYRNDDR